MPTVNITPARAGALCAWLVAALWLGLPAPAAAQPAPPASTTKTLYFAWLDVPRDISSQASALGMLADQLARAGGSSPTLDMIAKVERHNGSPREQVNALAREGSVQAHAGAYRLALDKFGEALALAGKTGDVEAQGVARIDIGVVQAALGDYAEAIRSTEQGHQLLVGLKAEPAQKKAGGKDPLSRYLELARQAMAPALQGQALRSSIEIALLNLGAIHAYMGQFADAFERYRQALALYPADDAPEGAATPLRAMASAAQQLGRAAEAQSYGQRAQRSGSSLIDDLSARAFGHIALRPDAGAPTLTAAVPLSMPTGPELARAPTSLKREVHAAEAAQAEVRGEFDAAIAAWRKAAAAAQAMGAADGLRTAHTQLQRLALRVGQPPLAIYEGKRAVNELQHQQERLVALDRDARKAFSAQSRSVYETLAEGLIAAQRLDEAEHALRLLRADASAEFVRADGRMPYNNAELALLGHEEAAAARWRASVETSATLLRDNPYTAQTFNSGEEVVAVRKARIDNVEMLLAIAEQNAAQASPQATMALAMLLANLRPQIENEVRPKACPDLVDDPRIPALKARLVKLQMQADKNPPPRLFGLPPAALAMPAAVPGVGSPQAMDKAWCLQLEQVALARAVAQPDAALLRALQARAPGFASADAGLLDAGRKAMAALGPGNVTLQYLIGESRLRIVFVSGTARVARDVAIDRKALDLLVERFRAALRNPRVDVLAPARELHRVLIEPVQPELERSGARTLILSPDGSLRYLPFAALHDGRRWLVERFALALGGPLEAGAGAAPRPWRVAGFGSTLAAQGLQALTGVAPELKALVRDEAQGSPGLLPGIVRLDGAFTAQALRDALAQRYPVVHIASHFMLSAQRAGDSFLLLGDGTRLTLQALKRGYRFDGVDLLTLSACDTGLDNSDSYGQEFEGLGAIVRSQGAAAVVATLWQVDDRSTGAFMSRFYATHELAKQSRAESLRMAQLEFIGAAPTPASAGAGDTAQRGGVLVSSSQENPAAPADTAVYLLDPAHRHAHPYYWAPFVLMGNWL